MERDDPFGLRSLDVERLRVKRGAKWGYVDAQFSAWVADMDFPVAPPIREALREIIDHDEFGYPNWGGPEALSPAATMFPARMAERYGWEPDPGRLHDMSDVVQGVRAAVLHLSQPGDGVVLHMPAYHPFLGTIETMQRRLIAVEPGELLDASGNLTGYEFDYDRLERELAAGSGGGRAKVWILCHPHNPLGHVFDRAELETIAAIAERHDLTVISDEIHAELTLAPAVHVPFASIGPDAAARTVTVTSTSKPFNLAGMRWAVLHSGSDAMESALAALPSHYLGANNVLGVAATVAAWTDGGEWLAAVHQVLDENRLAITGLLAQHLPGARYRPPSATYLAWIDLRHAGYGDDPAEVCRGRGVELSAGLQFGPQGTGHARLNFATSPEILAATVAAMSG
jgi:cystathionine beta-lyase